MSDEEWQRLAKQQDGLLTRRQALRSLTDKQVDRRLRAGGPWQLVARGVIATFTGGLTEQQRRRAALLRVGTHGAITGATALSLYGVRAAPKCPHVHVATLAPHQFADDRFTRVETVTRMAIRTVSRLRVVTLAQAVVSACLRLGALDDVRAIAAEVVGPERVTVAEIDQAMASSTTRGSKHLRQALREVDAGAASAPEANWLAAVSRSDVLPVPHVNCSV